MTEEALETQDTETTETAETTETQEQTPEPKFNEAQLQQMYSAVGRIVKNQFDEHVIPMLQGQASQKEAPKAETTDNLDRALGGDFDGAVESAYEKLERKKRESLTKGISLTKQALTSYSEQPFYKDIYTEAEKLAGGYLSQGYPPQAAAKMAFIEAKATHLQGQLSGGDVNLGMSSGSTKKTEKKKAKLPDAFKKAAARDIAKGIFTDEADYINSLSPDIRKRYGI